jgi:hypothetical protein
MDVAGQSRIYSALTVAAAAGNRFHAAIEYASEIALLRERLRAFSETVSAWQAMREKIGDEQLDELVDHGAATLDEARDSAIRRRSSIDHSLAVLLRKVPGGRNPDCAVRV